MSGTSVDAIDAALVNFSDDHSPELLHAQATPFPEELRASILTIIQEPSCANLDMLGALDIALGHAYADAVKALLETAEVEASEIVAIGNHGQTVRHQPDSELPFSTQLGDASIIAEHTSIATVADFRSRDLAAGGQGAPLVPAFHQALFDTGESRVVLNIGGIANITVLGQRDEGGEALITGVDTGPGNTLLDAACQHYLEENYDANGDHARQGTVIAPLFKALSSDDYFSRSGPKSTGREHFNLHWLNDHLREHDDIEAVDLLATLSELTAWSIAESIRNKAPDTQRVMVCGGGIHNTDLIQRIQSRLDCLVVSTEQHGLHPDWVEATAFAWLAKRCIDRQPGNLPSVTGAIGPRILGAIYPA
ncbi:anhydro-N-acetylmuramic acid kinase [gamma proteobacterium HTCC5015]|nr:anhydro-N-acetylmuramic acid kinase [gamma proteobacterium HTCC5015]